MEREVTKVNVLGAPDTVTFWTGNHATKNQIFEEEFGMSFADAEWLFHTITDHVADDETNKKILGNFLLHAKLLYGEELADLKREEKRRFEAAERIRWMDHKKIWHTNLRYNRWQQKCKETMDYIKKHKFLPPRSNPRLRSTANFLMEHGYIKEAFFSTHLKPRWNYRNAVFPVPPKLESAVVNHLGMDYW